MFIFDTIFGVPFHYSFTSNLCQMFGQEHKQLHLICSLHGRNRIETKFNVRANVFAIELLSDQCKNRLFAIMALLLLISQTKFQWHFIFNDFQENWERLDENVSRSGCCFCRKPDVLRSADTEHLLWRLMFFQYNYFECFWLCLRIGILFSEIRLTDWSIWMLVNSASCEVWNSQSSDHANRLLYTLISNENCSWWH